MRLIKPAFTLALSSKQILRRPKKLPESDAPHQTFSRKLPPLQAHTGQQEVFQIYRNKDFYCEKFEHALKTAIDSAQFNFPYRVEVGQTKDITRALEKLEAKIPLLDIFRAKVIVDIGKARNSVEKLREVTHSISKEFEKCHIEVDTKDSYQSPYSSGYRDIKLILKFEEFFAELQIVSKKFSNKAHKFDHALYEARRQKNVDPEVEKVILRAQLRNFCPVAIEEDAVTSENDPCRDFI